MRSRALLFAVVALPSVAFGAFPYCLIHLITGALRKPSIQAPTPAIPQKSPAEARQALLAWLEHAPGQERQLVEYLSQTPWMKAMFNYDGSIVGWHTRMVLGECAQRWDQVDWLAIAVPDGFGLAMTVKVALAFHDIGKGVREYWRARGARTQHDFTVPILEKAMAELGFGIEETALAVALVGHDTLGTMIQNRLSVDAAHDALLQRQKATVLSPKDFFRIQTFFYVADVASYSELRDEVLDRRQRQPMSPRFRALAEKF